MTDKAPNLLWDIDRHHGHAKTKKELDDEKCLKDAIENEEMQENLERIHKHTHVPPAA